MHWLPDVGVCGALVPGVPPDTVRSAQQQAAQHGSGTGPFNRRSVS